MSRVLSNAYKRWVTWLITIFQRMMKNQRNNHSPTLPFLSQVLEKDNFLLSNIWLYLGTLSHLMSLFKPWFVLSGDIMSKVMATKRRFL